VDRTVGLEKYKFLTPPGLELRPQLNILVKIRNKRITFYNMKGRLSCEGAAQRDRKHVVSAFCGGGRGVPRAEKYSLPASPVPQDAPH
jgi:hypothetical protein